MHGLMGECTEVRTLAIFGGRIAGECYCCVGVSCLLSDACVQIDWIRRYLLGVGTCALWVGGLTGLRVERAWGTE